MCHYRVVNRGSACEELFLLRMLKLLCTPMSVSTMSYRVYLAQPRPSNICHGGQSRTVRWWADFRLCSLRLLAGKTVLLESDVIRSYKTKRIPLDIPGFYSFSPPSTYIRLSRGLVALLLTMADDSNVTKAVSNGIAPPPFQLPVCIYAMRFLSCSCKPTTSCQTNRRSSQQTCICLTVSQQHR